MTAALGRLETGTQDLFLALTAPHQDQPEVFLPFVLNRPWWTGRQIEAQVRRLRAGSDGGGGFCEGPDGQTYFLKRTQGLHEGQGITVEVLGEPRGPKPAWARVIEGPAEKFSLSKCLGWLGHRGPIKIQDLQLLKALRVAYPHDDFVLGRQNLDLSQHAQEVLDTHQLHHDTGTCQASARWDPTPTAHMIDIDGTGPVAQINRAGAEMAAQLILSRNLGGVIFIDFLPPKTRQDRQDLTAGMTQTLSSWPHKIHIHPMNASGHLIIERQHLGPCFIASAFAGPNA